ncbi:MAG: hypothetical protein ABJ092_04885 [Gillisia sp.]
MKLKQYPLALAILFVAITSCKNSNSGDDVTTDDVITIEGDTRDANDPEATNTRATQGRDNDNNQTPEETPDGVTVQDPDTPTSNTTGTYIKIGEESDSNCNCYCLDLNTAGNKELCLVSGEMYITSRFQKNSDNSIDVYLVEPAARNTQGKDIPWKDFDRNSPIAKIIPQANGEMDFDWLGFKINGDLAIDYAIFGKKTLEGQYKKK